MALVLLAMPRFSPCGLQPAARIEISSMISIGELIVIRSGDCYTIWSTLHWISRLAGHLYIRAWPSPVIPLIVPIIRHHHQHPSDLRLAFMPEPLLHSRIYLHLFLTQFCWQARLTTRRNGATFGSPPSLPEVHPNRLNEPP